VFRLPLGKRTSGAQVVDSMSSASQCHYVQCKKKVWTLWPMAALWESTDVLIVSLHMLLKPHHHLERRNIVSLHIWRIFLSHTTKHNQFKYICNPQHCICHYSCHEKTYPSVYVILLDVSIEKRSGCQMME
jgi:hypothetical protein